ncbi:hypothetical protein [Halococcus thailandensis]|jgi:hypothetical protein|uniref:Uncharacterized protein n=1 Tax=Halococcus thailandensis JCM 13552 TaxID=1227457 RepID=M0NHX9_9EURY|nr:hypothetical protein [Halococcus thailandensis]EMA56719.1 hypothetical protein C451_01015 [Halococcus thailandensis JCM 13552]
MIDASEFPFEEWSGTHVQHLTVSPEGVTYVIPSGAHERLHRVLIGNHDPTTQLPGDERTVGGTKVDLALIGWAQLQSDTMTDRINIDAPDGFTDGELVQRFAALHDAGSVHIMYYPSGDARTSMNPRHVSLSHDGDRVPVAFEC